MVVTFAADNFDADKSRWVKSIVVKFPMGTTLLATALKSEAKDGVHFDFDIIATLVHGKGEEFTHFTVAHTDKKEKKQRTINCAPAPKTKEAELAMSWIVFLAFK